MTDTTPDTPERSGSPRTTRPALDILDRDQDRLLYAGEPHRDPPIKPLVDGFETRQELIEWYQAAAVRTLGHVAKFLRPRDILGENVLTASYIPGDDNQLREYVRQRTAEKLNQTCDIAYQELRLRAQERVSEDFDGEPDYTSINPESQRNPAQRPAFRVMDETQAAVLLDLWGGFRHRQAVSRWVKQLRAATNGEQPQGLMDAIVQSPILLDALLGQTPLSGQQQWVVELHPNSCVESGDDVARLVRERFAIEVLLPAFLKGARTLRGSERVETVADDNPWNEVRDMEGDQ